MSFTALVDCNNFFVSCEKVFNPSLWGKAVVVLSSEGGCILARSQEAKALGLPMGAPVFQWKEVIDRHGVILLAPNFSLYGDMSHRVMETLASFHPEREVYSIDEAFFSLEGVKDPVGHCHKVRSTIQQWTGIPVSIGIGTTKTLAKVANAQAKKEKSGVYGLLDSASVEAHLQKLPVKEIWGIGRRTSETLAKHGVFSAAQFKEQEDHKIQKMLSIVGVRIAWELRGKSCFTVEEVPIARKSAMTSRTFERPIFEKEELAQAVASYASRGAEKLREEGLAASWVHVFILTNPHRDDASFYGNQDDYFLLEPTNDTPTLITCAKELLDRLFKKGYAYKKAGVLLGGLVSEEEIQQNFFAKPKAVSKRKAAMEVMDLANKRFSTRVLSFAAEGTERPWARHHDSASPRYTTRWEDVLKIRI